MALKSPPADVVLINKAIRDFLNSEYSPGQKIGSVTCGVYAFFDYDGEPIYVGQTVEGLRGRIGRHLTGRRSDAVGKYVLDPFEVLEIEIWPLPDLANLPAAEKTEKMNQYEYAVFAKALAASSFNAVLNEGLIAPRPDIELPRSVRERIIPTSLYEERNHPDLRLARRALTISNLARLISEREVRRPLRMTLLVQCQRLEALAKKRFADFSDEPALEENVDG